MSDSVWKTLAASLLAAVIAGAGSMVALGRNNADRDYVDEKVEKVSEESEENIEKAEGRIYKRLDRIEVKLDRVLEK